MNADFRVRFGLLDGAWVDVAALHLSSFTGVKFLTLSLGTRAEPSRKRVLAHLKLETS